MQKFPIRIVSCRGLKLIPTEYEVTEEYESFSCIGWKTATHGATSKT
jgi:hypothetical protein